MTSQPHRNNRLLGALLGVFLALPAAAIDITKSAEDYFHNGAMAYLSNNIPAALNVVTNGLEQYPGDEKLKKLEALLKQQQQEQNQNQNQDQQQEQQKSDEQKQQDQKDQQKQDEQKNEQQKQQEKQEQMSQDRMEAMLRQVREREKLKEQRDKEMKAYLMRSDGKVEKDW